MTWFFKYPHNPYVSCSVSLDFGSAQAYLRSLNDDDARPRVSIQHLLTAAVARVYREFPAANATIIGSRIYRHEHVGVAMPVNMLETGGSLGLETSLIFVERVDCLSLRGLALATQERVASLRDGEGKSNVWRNLAPLVGKLPDAVIHATLDAFEAICTIPFVGEAVHRSLPITVAVSNPGAAFSMPAGGAFRAASFAPPNRLFAVGSVLGVSALQDEVVPIAGRPEVRTMLPLIYVFDHRLFDGVMCARILNRLGTVLLSPEDCFGPAGDDGGAAA